MPVGFEEWGGLAGLLYVFVLGEGGRADSEAKGQYADG